MECDEGIDADNPYHAVSLIYCGFTCERCGEFCSGDDEESSEQTPCRLMAEAVTRAGRLVRDRDAVRCDYEGLCPACPGTIRGERQTPNQALQRTAGACRLSGVRSSLGPRRC